MTEKGRSTSVPTLHFKASLHGNDRKNDGDDNDNNDDNNKNSYKATMIIGKKASVEALLPKLLSELSLNVAKPVIDAMVASLDENTGGGPSSTMIITDNDDSVHHLQVAGLPSKLSRHNHPMAVHTLTSLASKAVKGKYSRLIVLSDDFSVGPLGLAIAKSFPLFSMKTDSGGADNDNNSKELHIGFYNSNSTFVTDPQQLEAAQVAAKGAQLTARLVDMYPELLTTTQFSKEVQLLVNKHAEKVKMTEIVGKELEGKGYGALYGVGKAANCPPRLVILEYDGSSGSTDEKTETVALVGKGIVFDTGGLSLKVNACIVATNWLRPS